MTHTVVQILGHGDIADLARGDRSDGQLLDLFVQKRDQEAFASLVQRHGPMVLGVCRRILRNPADADDAFQAAFLVLARKAGTLTARELLAQWLHGVAFNTARKLRRSNSRRAVREKPLAEVPEPSAAGASELQDELLALLDEELNRLPERYRTPIVLCDLEGATRKQAARLIGCPEGTVAGRLARARAMLADRLTRRGVMLPAVLLAALRIERSAIAANVPEVLRAVATGSVAPRVADVTERVLNAMFAKKIKAAVFAMLFCGLVFASMVAMSHLTAKAEADPAAPPEAKAEKPKPAPEAKPGEKIFTHIPLKTSDANEMAPKLLKLFPKSVTIAPVRDENAIIVYATEAETKEVLAALKGEVGEPAKSAPEKKYTINFRSTPWADVLAWYAKESGLADVSASRQTGNVTITPPKDRQFTIGEITDLLNEGLLDKKFILIRREKTFVVHPADEKVDPTWIPRVEVADLKSRGKSELVEVVIPLGDKDDAADLAPEIKKLLTPFGDVAFAKGKRLIVRDTVGNLQRITNTLRELDNKGGPGGKRCHPTRDHSHTTTRDSKRRRRPTTSPNP